MVTHRNDKVQMFNLIQILDYYYYCHFLFIKILYFKKDEKTLKIFVSVVFFLMFFGENVFSFIFIYILIFFNFEEITLGITE